MSILYVIFSLTGLAVFLLSIFTAFAVILLYILFSGCPFAIRRIEIALLHLSIVACEDFLFLSHPIKLRIVI
jgi:hypothetical protein